MSALNLKCVCIARFGESTIVATHVMEKSFEFSYKNEAQNLISKLKLVNLTPDERQRCSTQSGAWFCRVDKNDFLYLILCNTNYPERHAYKLAAVRIQIYYINSKEIEEQIVEIPNFQDEADIAISKHVKKFLPSLMKKYDDLVGLDKIHAAQEKAEQIQVVMNKNIQGMFDNMQNVEKLEQKSTGLSDAAKIFQKDSTTLKRLALIRLWKLRIMVCLIVLAILLYILVPIISKSDSTSGPNNNSNTNTTRLL